MIEKLKGIERDYGDYTATELIASNSELFLKINEIINVLNAIVVDTKDGTFIDGSKKAEAADRFAVQRRWIGKLCKFWDNKKEDGFYCVLGRIDKDDEYPYVRQGYWDARYKHCEPVSEDLIYKGE